MKARKIKWRRRNRWRKIKFFVGYWIPEESRAETRTFKTWSTASYFRKLTDSRLFGRKVLDKVRGK